MKITIHPTSKIVNVRTDGPDGGIASRVWEGITEDGIPVNVFITRLVPIMERDDPRQGAFQNALHEVEPPSETAHGWPARLIL